MLQPERRAEWIWLLIPPLLIGLTGLFIYLSLPRKQTATASTATGKIAGEIKLAGKPTASRPPADQSPAEELGFGSYAVRLHVFEDRREDYSQISLLKDALTGRLGTDKGTHGKERPPVNSDRVRVELEDWLQSYHLTSHDYYEQDPDPGKDDRPDIVLSDYGHWGWVFNLDVFNQPRKVLDNLERRLLKLRGVYDLKITAGTPQFDGKRHYIELTEQFDVRINGQKYHSPEDFNENENLLIRVRSYEGTRAPRYMAFFSLDLQGHDRFGFGDIVRLGYDGDVQTYDTLVEHWEISAEQRKRLLSGELRLMGYRNPDRTISCVRLELPDWMKESEFDPVAEFEAILAQKNPVPAKEGSFATVVYEVHSKEDMARLTGHEIVKQAADPDDAALETEFMAAAKGWLAANPKYRSRNVFARPVRYWAVREGGVLLELRCYVGVADPLPVANDLAATLGQISRLPSPWIREEHKQSSRSD